MNQAELQRVYEAVATDLNAYIERVCGNATEAEDVFQETFTRLLASGFSSEHENDARRYVFRIATNLMRDRMRWSSRWRFGKMPETTGRAHESRYLDQIDAHRALSKMKPKQRALLWLAYVEGLPHNEIAETLGIASTSVRVMLARARKKLVAHLGKESL